MALHFYIGMSYPLLTHNIFLMSSCEEFFILSVSSSASPLLSLYTTRLFIHIQKETRKKITRCFFFNFVFLLFHLLLLLLFSGGEQMGIGRAVVKEAKEELGVGSGRILEDRGSGVLCFGCWMRF